MIKRWGVPWKTTRLPLVLAAVVSAVLLASTLYIRHTIRKASQLVVAGVASSLALDVRTLLRDEGLPPPETAAQAFLDGHADQGLRYFAIVDEQRRVRAAVGHSSDPARLDEGTSFDGHRARFVHPIPGGPRSPRMRGDRGGEGRPPRWWVVYEFEPLPALALEQQASTLLAISVLSVAGILALAIALSRALEQRERMTEELERGRRLAALGEMSAVMAHELRNPLASLKGHAQLLAESVEADPKLAPKAGRVVDEAIRIEALMTDLLAYVKGGDPRREPTNPNEVLRAAVDAAGHERIEARYLDAPPTAPIDPARVQQALENVLRNALQAQEDGKIEAEVSSERGGGLCFTVRDRGPGVPRGDEERIFEPFVTGKTRGVGLGLAITRRIVEQHGGTVTVHERPGGGAEFRLRLPERRA